MGDDEISVKRNDPSVSHIGLPAEQHGIELHNNLQDASLALSPPRSVAENNSTSDASLNPQGVGPLPSVHPHCFVFPGLFSRMLSFVSSAEL